ncbi:hypothetical protein GCM10012278_08610 [Nonomuraea glycinis]|uniref:Transposase IS110-like N-terminal domain-containing protein n=1 Tax=Nonomuraea glycinis TaxID=2047744 RepID=A0A917ZZQ3_9ACTN|nr:hypothetical protein GCM10012278_08610 [Nonomuraea glycinis]
MLSVGDDWAEEYHDVELQDERGKRPAKARLEEGIAGISRLHELIGRHVESDKDFDRAEVFIGIETDRGLWVQALIAAGYQVYAINPAGAEYSSVHVMEVMRSLALPVRHDG